MDGENTSRPVEDTTQPRSASPNAELGPGTIVGRYVVVSKLGSGGMGVVFAAYDPELDRKIALKLLDARGGDRGPGQARLQREAQALARLNHPNVVTVHDVGVHSGHVFVAMEFVEGDTLAAWMARSEGEPPRPWVEVVRVFAAVGRGLAAAHEAGLVHRDVKPDNVMFARDGRVLVMDFGLARSEEEQDASTSRQEPPPSGMDHDLLRTPLTRTGALMGTPAYMAPEQFASLEVTARSDQFSYCVALYEALYGKRPFAGDTVQQLALTVINGEVGPPPRRGNVPAWLRRIVSRGLSPDPERRFATMADLLAALERGSARRRRNRWLAALGGVAVVAAGGLGAQRYERNREIESCKAVGDTIDEVWNEEAREAVRSGLLTSGAAMAPIVVDKLTPWIDEYTQSWREHAATACTNHRVHGDWDAATLDKAQWCLDQGRLELATLLDELAVADEHVVHSAVPTAASLPPMLGCVDTRSLAAMVDPVDPQLRPQARDVRRSLTRADYLVDARKLDEALALARDARKRSEALQWPPLTSAALAVEANVLGYLERYEEAETVGVSAFMKAARCSAWDVAAFAAIDLIDLVGVRRARHAEAQTWAQLASVAITHAADPLGLREASRSNNLGNVYQAMGKYDEAVALQKKAAALFEESLGSGHLQMATVLNNHANTLEAQGKYDEAKASHQRALAIRRDVLGAEHPLTATSLSNLGGLHASLGQYDEATALFEQSLSIAQNSGSDDLLVVNLRNLGVVRILTGDTEEAKGLLERALKTCEESSGLEHPDVAAVLESLGALHYELGEYTEAAALHERALRIREQRLEPDNPFVASSLHNLGVAQMALGQPGEAIPLLDRAVTIREQVYGPEHPRLVRSLLALGKALVEDGQHERALEGLERAVAVFPSEVLDAQLLATARFDLARALWEAPVAARDRARARELAQLSRDGFTAASEDRADVEQWLARHPRPR